MPKKFFTVLFLVILVLASWYFALTNFDKNKSDIFIQASDFFSEISLPYKILKLQILPPDDKLLLPIATLTKKQIDDTWGDARSEGRTHEGVDIFAKRNTPVFSATYGYVIRVGVNELGGNIVLVMGAGGKRYYYAHFEKIADGVKRGSEVTTDTVLGFVGNSGNASTTPPHLHFGMYDGREASNPYPLIINR